MAMDKWKAFFQSSGSDLWTVIDRAITLAATEYPSELRARRDKFTEKMFCPTSHLAGLCECDDEEDEEGGGGGDGGSGGGGGKEEEEEEEDKGHRSEEEEEGEEEGGNESDAAAAAVRVVEDDEDEENEQRRKRSSSFVDVEALSEEMEEESRRIREISKLKNRISNPDEFEDYLCEDLEALERMHISFEVLKTTEIGKPVNNLRKHPSPSVRTIVKRLIKSWKALADEWAKSAEHVTAAGGGASDGNDDEYGLPSPPVDEGELFAAGAAPLEVNKLFDFMEDDMSGGSEQMKGDNSPVDLVNGIYEDAESPTDVYSKHQSKAAASTRLSSEVLKSRKENITNHNNYSTTSRLEGGSSRSVREISSKSSAAAKTSINGRSSEQQQHRTSAGVSSSSRPRPPSASTSGGLQQRAKSSLNARSRTDERLISSRNKNSSPGGEAPEKLAAAKRRLQEGYQQAENAKKQRTVRVMELTDLPKGKGGPKAASKTKSHPQHNHRYSSQPRR